MDIIVYFSREQEYYSTKVVPQTQQGTKWCSRNLKKLYCDVYAMKGYTGPTIGNHILDMAIAGLRVEIFEGEPGE